MVLGMILLILHLLVITTFIILFFVSRSYEKGLRY